MNIMSMLSPFFEMLAGLIQKVLAIALIFGTTATPSTETPIKAVNPDDVRVTFTCLGDTQVNAMNGNVKYFEAILQDVDNAETAQDAFMIVGDITENSLDSEWADITELMLNYNYGEEVVFATGNHDIRLRDYEEVEKKFTDCVYDVSGKELDSFIYSTEINGYTFVVMGSESEEMEEADISVEQIKWVDETITEATSTGKPVFVVLHQPLKDTHGLPLTWGNGTNRNAGHVGDASDLILETLNKHNNVILITGHLHTGFGQYTYEKVGNIHAVNVPGAGKGNADGDYCDYATGFSVEVYDDEVIFRARDFGKGIYLPEYDVTIPVER